MRVAVISLKKTPERWDEFVKRNRHLLRNCELIRINGIDGIELINSNIKSRLISTSARQEWSAGAIGIGLTHLFCWRMCCNSRSPLVVLEDDVLLADDWQFKLEQHLNRNTSMVLLGWNLDSMLRCEFGSEQEMISLFEPAYPSEKSLLSIVNSSNSRQIKRLRYAFGLPGYWIQPEIAQLLLNKINRLQTLPLHLGRGFPDISTYGIDAMLNLYYQNIGAQVIVPPLALAINNPLTSLTRSGPSQFRGTNT